MSETKTEKLVTNDLSQEAIKTPTPSITPIPLSSFPIQTIPNGSFIRPGVIPIPIRSAFPSFRNVVTTLQSAQRFRAPFLIAAPRPIMSALPRPIITPIPIRGYVPIPVPESDKVRFFSNRKSANIAPDASYLETDEVLVVC